MLGGTPGRFKYAPLNGAVNLDADATYYLVSSELAGGDQWLDEDTRVTPATGTVDGSIWDGGGTWFGSPYRGHTYAPVSFRYSSGF